MEIPGFGASNHLRLNPNTIKPADALPVKVPPQLDEKTTQKGDAKLIPVLPDQAPTKPVINKTQQSFVNLLTEIGMPNTPQNNDLAQSLANYGQPINKTTMTQVSNNLGNIMQQGPVNIEAGLVLLINKLPVNKKSVDSVKEMLTGGGLSQNFLSLNKDLQKLVAGSKDTDFVKSLEAKIRIKQKNLGQSMDKVTDKTDMIQDRTINQVKAMPMNSDQKIEQSGIVKKNPFEEEFSEENNGENNFNDLEKMPKNKALAKPDINNKSLITGNSANLNSTLETGQQNSNKNNEGFSLLSDVIENDNILLDNQNKNIDVANKDIKTIVNQLLSRAEKLSITLNNIVNIDVLKNPANFPQQIAMLKKSYGELEVDIVEMNEILESSFSEIKSETKTEDENLFTNLLKLVFDDGKTDNIKKGKAKNIDQSLNLDSDLIKNLSESTKSISESISGRQILANSQESLCIPLVIPYNNSLYNVEIKINREDQSNKKAELGEVPLKIQLAIETKNMGKVGVDMSNLKKDLQINLNVDNNSIKNVVSQKLTDLQNRLENLPFDVKPVTCNLNPRPNESPSILLPHKYKVMGMRRIDGIV